MLHGARDGVFVFGTGEHVVCVHAKALRPLAHEKSLDLRVAKHFRIGSTSAEVYLDVQNVTDHTNDEEIVYNPNYTQRGYITGFPILPVLGARWAW